MRARSVDRVVNVSRKPLMPPDEWLESRPKFLAAAGALNKRFQFLDFRTDAEADAEYALTVTLARAGGGGTEVAEFGFQPPAVRAAV